MKETEKPLNAPAARGTKKRKRRTTLRVALGVALLLVLGGAAACVWWRIHENERLEALAYEVLDYNIDPRDYETFLERYPTSPHVPEVRARLAALQEMQAEWARIERHGSPADFRNFRQRYDVEHYRKLCDEKIDSLDYEAARADGSAEAFARYLAEHSEGAYYAEAEAARTSAERLSVTSEERIETERAVESFFQALGANDAAGVCALVAPEMDVFLGRRGATKADVMDMMENMFGPHIRSCSFTVGNDLEVSKSPAEGGGVRRQASVSVDQHIRRTNDGKTFGSYRAEIGFDAAMRISSVRLTEISRRDGKGEASILQKVVDYIF